MSTVQAALTGALLGGLYAVMAVGLSVSWGMLRVINLDGITLRISRGELVGLVGPNGSGKTTLVSLLAGGLKPTSGSIRIAGTDTTGLAPHTVAHGGVARTYQIPLPFESMTVRDNVAMALMFGRRPRRLARAEAMAYLEFVGLASLAGARPAEINLHQRQLLEMARALAPSPTVLLLDEPSLGLAPVVIDEVFQAIEAINAEGVSVLLVEQEVERALAVSDRGYLLAEGRIVASGPAAELRNNPEVRRSVLGQSA